MNNYVSKLSILFGNVTSRYTSTSSIMKYTSRPKNTSVKHINIDINIADIFINHQSELVGDVAVPVSVRQAVLF